MTFFYHEAPPYSDDDLFQLQNLLLVRIPIRIRDRNDTKRPFLKIIEIYEALKARRVSARSSSAFPHVASSPQLFQLLHEEVLMLLGARLRDLRTYRNSL
jgi:hypothetical protein